MLRDKLQRFAMLRDKLQPPLQLVSQFYEKEPITIRHNQNAADIFKYLAGVKFNLIAGRKQVAYVWHPNCNLQYFLRQKLHRKLQGQIASCDMALIVVKFFFLVLLTLFSTTIIFSVCFFFWKFYVILYCFPVLVIVLIHGIMLVSWRFLSMLLFPFWSHSLSYLVRCSISSWVSKQTAHNCMPII